MNNFWTAFVMYGGAFIGILAWMIGSIAIKERSNRNGIKTGNRKPDDDQQLVER